MRIEDEFTLGASAEVVADGLLDVVTVSRCVPGVSNLREVDEDRFEAVLQLRIGPIRTAFAGQLTLDRTQVPNVITATGSGVDRTSGSTAAIELQATLVPTSTGTIVQTVADVVLRGRLGQFGSGIIRATSSELLRQFVACFESTLAVVPAVSSSDASADAVVSRPASADRLTLWRLVTATIVGLVRRIVATWRARWRRGTRDAA